MTDEYYLDLDAPRSWDQPIWRWLEGLRSSYLQSLDAAEAAGAPEHVVALRPVVERMLPCRVTVYPEAHPPLVEFRLDGEPYGFFVERMDVVPEISEQAADENVILLAKETHVLIWLPIRSPDQISRSAYFLRNAIDDILHVRALKTVEERRTAVERTYESVGYHATPTPEPSGPPDARWSHFVRISPTGAIPVTLEHLRSQLADTRVLRCVPPDVESLVAQARLLYLYGWEKWEFYALAEQQATFALEAAMTRLYDHWLETTQPRLHGERSGADVEIDAGPRRNSVLRVARKLGIRRPRANGHRIPASIRSVAGALKELGFLTEWESAKAKLLIEMRNEFAHPPFAQLHLDTWAIGVLAGSASLINAMWHRALRGVANDRPG